MISLKSIYWSNIKINFKVLIYNYSLKKATNSHVYNNITQNKLWLIVILLMSDFFIYKNLHTKQKIKKYYF